MARDRKVTPRQPDPRQGTGRSHLFHGKGQKSHTPSTRSSTRHRQVTFVSRQGTERSYPVNQIVDKVQAGHICICITCRQFLFCFVVCFVFLPTTDHGLVTDGSIRSGSDFDWLSYCSIRECNLPGLLWNFPRHIHTWTNFVEVS